MKWLSELFCEENRYEGNVYCLDKEKKHFVKKETFSYKDSELLILIDVTAEIREKERLAEERDRDALTGIIRSRGDQALFGGKSTQEMKQLLGVKDSRPLADFLPTLTIAAKNLATEMTNYNVEEKDLQGENAISNEHVQNNSTVRNMLGTRGIKPEELPASEDIRKLERKVKSQEKKLASESGKLPSED